MKKLLVFIAFLIVFGSDLYAQCPMCRMTAETNLQNGGTMGSGLNSGILYMLLAPYLIVGGIAYWWWRNRNNNEDELAQDEWLRPNDEVSSLN